VIFTVHAIQQLYVVGDSIGVEVYSEPENKILLMQNAIKHAKANGFNVVIVDTAGRLAVDKEMMDELMFIKQSNHKKLCLLWMQ
jgi:signal recognition particle subunit SRP54